MYCIEGKNSTGLMNLYIGINKGGFNVLVPFVQALKFHDIQSAKDVVIYLKNKYQQAFDFNKFEITEHLEEETSDRLIFGFNKEDIKNYRRYKGMNPNNSTQGTRQTLFGQLPTAFKIDVTTNRDEEKNFILKQKETIEKIIQEAELC
jgi:hypothetical protein